MHRLLLFLKPLVRLNVRHPYAVLSVAILLGLMAAAFAVRLKIDTDIANLLPDDNPRVVALNELRDTVGGDRDGCGDRITRFQGQHPLRRGPG